MKHRVVLTGLGCVTPIGKNLEESWNSVLQGKSGTGRVTQVDANIFISKVSAEVKGFEPLQFLSAKLIKKTDRFVQFAVAGAKMAVENSGLDLKLIDPDRCGVLIGSGIGGLRIIEEQHKIFLEKGPKRISPFL